MNDKQILPHVHHIEEDYRDYCTLVQGKTLAILWDTGQGKRDLRAFLEETVNTPYIVLNSHGHADHIGGNHRFERVYANRADWPLLAAQTRLAGGGGGRSRRTRRSPSTSLQKWAWATAWPRANNIHT